jgi:hypothetical protein
VIGPVPPAWVRERGVHWLTSWGLIGDSQNAAPVTAGRAEDHRADSVSLTAGWSRSA